MHASELQRIQTLLSSGADADANWTWSAQNQALWTQTDTLHQDFYDKWRGSEPALYNPADSDTNPPYVLNLGELTSTTNDTNANILVTASFVKMLHRLLLLRSDVLNQRIDAQGVVITGQPGKTTFLTFLLAQLLASHQVVLLVSSETSHLFFQGKIYVPRPSLSPSSSSPEHMPYSGFHFLPTHTGHRALHSNPYPIWALINVNADDPTPVSSSALDAPDNAIAIPTNCNVWPIMTCPPDGPARYACWRKQRRGCLWGMPLWTVEELLAGLALQPTYTQFRSDLEKALQGHDDPALRSSHMIDTLKLLDHLTSPSSSPSSSSSKSKSNNSTLTVDEALQLLLHNAILEFGPVPRDVYTAVLSSLSSAPLSHSNKLETLTLKDLHRLVLTFIHESKLESGAECVLAIVPSQNVSKLDAWDVRFKSGRIARRMLDKALSAEEGDSGESELWVMFRSLRKIKAASTMAKWVFSMIGHRALCAPSPSPSTSTNSQSGVSTPIRMTADSDAPSLFSTRGSCGRNIITSDSETPRDLCTTPTREEGRKPVRIDLTGRDISSTNTITLDDDKYYIPIPDSDDTDPLFDSFTIHQVQDEDTRTIRISVFRFTILSSSASDARPHGQSAGGGYSYEGIRRIVTRVRELLDQEARLSVPRQARGSETSSRRKRKASESELVDVKIENKIKMKIKVAYFLVHPGSGSAKESPISWQMPDGWTDERDGVRMEGEVFSLSLKVPET